MYVLLSRKYNQFDWSMDIMTTCSNKDKFKYNSVLHYLSQNHQVKFTSFKSKTKKLKRWCEKIRTKYRCMNLSIARKIMKANWDEKMIKMLFWFQFVTECDLICSLRNVTTPPLPAYRFYVWASNIANAQVSFIR